MTSVVTNVEQEVEANACAMKLRVYPTGGQQARANQWLWATKRFRNEAVAFLKERRVERAKWMAKHPVLAIDGIPEEFQGDDVGALSKWLTARLVDAREHSRVVMGLSGNSKTCVEEIHGWLARTRLHLTHKERDEITGPAWLLMVPRTALDQCIQDLKKTIDKARTDRKKAANPKSGGRGKRVAGYPGFRKYSHQGSVRLQVNASKNKAFADYWKAGKLMIPGIGVIKFRDGGYVLPKTPPKMITLSRSACGQWSASFVCVVGEYSNARKPGRKLPALTMVHRVAKGLPLEPLPLDSETGLPAAEGLDGSMGYRAVSNRHGYPKRISHHERYIKRGKNQQRSLSRKKKGSRRHHKAKVELAKTHGKIAATRRAEILTQVKQITKRSAIICVETLVIAFILQNRHLSRAGHNTALGLFFSLLMHESAKLGRLVLKSPRFAATTQTCPCCGFVNTELKNNLKIRTWVCPGCQTLHDRDIAAGDNIQAMALQHAIELLESSLGPENGPRVLSSHRLHPDLEAFIARGGLTAILEQHRARVSQAAGGTPAAAMGAKAPRAAVEARVLAKQPASACRERALAG